jgi:hypothetical protein
MKQLFIVSVSLFTFASCYENYEKKYEFTRKVPDSRLYEEMFTINSLGLYASYLTDSVSFRTFIGEVDLEHDYFKYIIKNGNIEVKKIKTGEKNCRWVTTESGHRTVLCDEEVIDIKSININHLKREGKFE